MDAIKNTLSTLSTENLNTQLEMAKMMFASNPCEYTNTFLSLVVAEIAKRK